VEKSANVSSVGDTLEKDFDIVLSVEIYFPKMTNL
jgi:hypothetical protein